MKKALAALALLLVGAAVGVGATVLVLDDDDGGTSAGPGSGSQATTAEDGSDDGNGAGAGGCDYEDTSGCVAGAEIVLDDGEWTCDEPLERYASSLGGELPLKVTARFTRPVETVAGIVDLTSGCTGDGTEAIDLILDIQGDGRTVGGMGDALTVKVEATDIDITGSIDCGPRGPEAHQDGIQALGANDIAFVDLEVGDWDEERATCSGASAGIDISLGGAAGLVPADYRCIRCRVVACRRAINVGESTNTQVTDGRFRSGNPAEREEPLATGVVGLCNFAVSPCNVDATAAGNVFEGNVCQRFPYDGGSGSRRR